MASVDHGLAATANGNFVPRRMLMYGVCPFEQAVQLCVSPLGDAGSASSVVRCSRVQSNVCVERVHVCRSAICGLLYRFNTGYSLIFLMDEALTSMRQSSGKWIYN